MDGDDASRRLLEGDGLLDAGKGQKNQKSQKSQKSQKNQKKNAGRDAAPRPGWHLRGVLAVCGALVLLAGFRLATRPGPQYEEPPYGLSPPWYPSPRGGDAASWAASYAKAAALVRRMTLAEKVNITTGTGWQMGLAVGTTGPAVHVGFPQLNLQDGPLGIRFADKATALPAGITAGATWNRALLYARGAAHGREARTKNIQVLLGPSVGPLGRMPCGGRNWEGFGTDPYLQGVAAAETVRGIQDQGVMATIKHFVANEQEHYRQPFEWGNAQALSSNVDDRTLHELYAWPFADAVRAGVASVMCSYNAVNNSYACANSKLLNGLLKDELGFQGFVQSDWLAQHSGVAAALAGLDMTMPGDGLRWQDGRSLWGGQLTRAVLNGSVPLARINDMAVRVVAAWYQLGQDDSAFRPEDLPNFSSWTDAPMGVLAPGSPSPQTPFRVNHYVPAQTEDHTRLARQVAAEGTVLLKNVGRLLPLGPDGRSQDGLPDNNSKTPDNSDTPLRIGIFGEDAGPGDGPNACPDRGCNQGTLGSGWGSGAVDFPYLVPPVDALAAAFDPAHVTLTTHLRNDGVAPATLAAQDLCLVFANADAGEGHLSWQGVDGDRNDLFLQKGGEPLVDHVARHCGGPVVVVVHAVGPVVVERWIDRPAVRAVLHAHLPGQESGRALADVLLGSVNPSGHLPYTIGKSLADYGPGAAVLYHAHGQAMPQQDFAEGLAVDYRHFDQAGVAPRFAFGFGLSYTAFALGNLTVAPQTARKTALPAPRPPPAAAPPAFDAALPDPRDSLFPPGLRRLKKYIYPYIESVDEARPAADGYPYPDGYDTVQPPSPAGGDVGGNPDLWTPLVHVAADVTNTGARAGQAVVQLYLSYPDTAVVDAAGAPVAFPVKVLRGFEKPLLQPGETTTVTFALTRRDLSYWDVVAQNWVLVTAGAYRFRVGLSSDDLPLEGEW